MQASHVCVSVSQTAQASQISQINFFKLAVDTFILRMENNLADPEEDFHFNNEDHIIEKAEQIDEMYANLSVSDEIKSELRQYIIQEADVFNSKFREVYGNVYMDNYFNFINCIDYDVFEAGKIKSEDQYKVKKCKVVYESDSESESESEVSMFSETQSESDSDDSDTSSSDSESEEETNICEHCDEYIMECYCENCPHCDEKMAVCCCVDDLKKRINNQIVDLNEKDDKIKELDGQLKRHQGWINRLIQNKKEIQNEVVDLKKESEENGIRWVKYAIEKDEEIKRLKDSDEMVNSSLKFILLKSSEQDKDFSIDQLIVKAEQCKLYSFQLEERNNEKDEEIKRLLKIIEDDKIIKKGIIQKSEEKNKKINELEDKLSNNYERMKKIEQPYIDIIKGLKNELDDAKSMFWKKCNELDKVEKIAKIGIYKPITE
jgi:hypothetical protein